MKANVKTIDWARLALLTPEQQVQFMQATFRAYEVSKVITCREYVQWCLTPEIFVIVAALTPPKGFYTRRLLSNHGHPAP